MVEIDSQDENVLEMGFDMTIVDNLGVRLYQNIPPVLAEMVANAWDADSKSVEITMPEGALTSGSEIQIKDHGCGMSFNELNSKFLVIGMNRRKSPDEKTAGGRKLMGRKGIGKLSVFGVSKEMVVSTVKGGLRNTFRMNIDEIKKCRAKRAYQPEILECKQPAKPGEKGTEVRLRHIQREKIDSEAVRRILARRFSAISSDFKVLVNGQELLPIKETVKDLLEFPVEEVQETISNDRSSKVEGWIGCLTKIPSKLGISEGIAVMAHGKLVQEPFYFGEPPGRHYAYSYMVGELVADFLDEQPDDLVGTDRKSIAWDRNEKAQKFMDWGKDKILSLSTEWDKQRRKKKRKKLLETEPIKKWYDDLTPGEKNVADQVFDIVVGSEIEDDRLMKLASYISQSFRIDVFVDVARRFKDTPPKDFTKIIELLQEWSILEARGMLDLIKGRLEIIETLERFVATNEYEKKIQKHLFDSPWLIHPTWNSWEKEIQLARILKKEFPDPEKKRVDLICTSAGVDVYVIELKRPDIPIGMAEVQQLKRYVRYLRDRKGTEPGPSRRYTGYLIGGKVVQEKYSNVKREIDEMQKDGYYFKTYAELVSDAKRSHIDFIEKLAKVEPEPEE